MTAIRLLGLAALISLSPLASATSLVGTTDMIGRALVSTTEGISDLSSSLKDDKIVLAAREDAASFVASQGEIRGARLHAALQHIRTQAPQLNASDLQLAEAILAL